MRERLVVEVDGFRFHSSRPRFAGDRRRRGYLLAHGYEVFPLTWESLGPEAAQAMANLAMALDRRRAESAGD